MPTNRTIYVITNLEANHNPLNSQPHRRLPVDERLITVPGPSPGPSLGRYIFYITDKDPIQEHQLRETIIESHLDPVLHKVGKDHLAEWSFLLAEEKHAFCAYPFFMISSRFYMKNDWLKTDLNEEWDRLFSNFEEYSHGFLPSYSRPMRWVNFLNLINNPKVFFPFTEKFSQLITDLYQTKIPEEYSTFPDLGCHYLGFRDRQALLDYVEFYKPILNEFFDADFNMKKEITDYVKNTGQFPNEKPLTFLFETLSHLYFYKNRLKFFCLHYNGYYEVDFVQKAMNRLYSFKLPFFTKLKRKIKWWFWWLKGEGHYWNLLKRYLGLRN
jgi:hypothetical protein